MASKNTTWYYKPFILKMLKQYTMYNVLEISCAKNMQGQCHISCKTLCLIVSDCTKAELSFNSYAELSMYTMSSDTSHANIN